MRSPIVCFRSDTGTPYAYDRGSNEIVRLAEPLFAKIRAIHERGDAGSGMGYTDGAEVNAVRAEDERARSLGLFADTPRPRMKPVFCDQCRAHAMESLHTLTLCITERCNLRCIYCSHSGLYPRERPHSQAVMSLDVAEAAVRYLLDVSKSDDALSISFYGGECMLHFPLLREIVSFAERAGNGRHIQYHFDTNGTLVRPEHVAFFLEHDTFVQVSIDGPRALHDRFRVTRRGKGTHDRVIETLRMIDLPPESGSSDELTPRAILEPEGGRPCVGRGSQKSRSLVC